MSITTMIQRDEALLVIMEESPSTNQVQQQDATGDELDRRY